MNWRTLKIGAMTAACLAAFVSSAGAVAISIGFSTTSTPPAAPASPPLNPATAPDSAVAAGVVGGFTILSTGTASPPLTPPDLLYGTSTDAATGAAGGHVFVFITVSDLSAPFGNLSFISSFTSQPMPVGFTAIESTYYNADNSVFGTSTLLSSATFLGLGTGVVLANQVGSALVGGVSPLYSITQVYEIIANGIGSANLTINVAAVPGPLVGMGLPGLLMACVALIALARRRRKGALIS